MSRVRRQRAPLIDMTGQRVGHWLVLRQSSARNRRGAIWTCRCSCGTERDVFGFMLRNGRSLSCQRGFGHGQAEAKS